jgi:iron complex outermembrane receptor protein
MKRVGCLILMASALLAVDSAIAADAESSGTSQIPEVVVTAQKKEQRLEDVPMPVSVISGDSLINSNQLLLKDYYSSVPGLSMTVGSQSTTVLAIRGISTGYADPTVGVAVDDVPYGSPTGISGGSRVPDIDPGDLARVEVLRGPQGTLYGASSLGGLLKFVTVDPSTDGVSGRVQAGTSSVYHGADQGYDLHASANVPLSNDFAVRASAFTRRDPGYIDNVQSGQRGVNSADVHGGRLASLWRPTETLSLKLSALFQDAKGDGFPYSQTGLGGDLLQSFLRGTGEYSRKTQAYSATLAAKLGSADLTAVSGYNIGEIIDSIDLVGAFGGIPLAAFGAPYTATAQEVDITTKHITQEFRVSAPIGQRVDWLFGVYYAHEDALFAQSYPGINPATGAVAPAGNGLSLTVPATFQEYAAFTDVTFRITDRFDVQLGGRESEIRQTLAQTETGPFVPLLFRLPSPYTIPENEAKNHSFTYLATPQFKVSPDLMVYARLASGYRPGGVNATPSLAIPHQYGPDTTKNYEIGLKGSFLERKLFIDTSLYYIDWSNIQIFVYTPLGNYRTNGAQAKSQGIEFSVESKPLTGMTLNAWVDYGDAVLTKDLPAATLLHGLSGDRLPNSSRDSGFLSLDQEFPLASSVAGFVGGSVSYVGDSKNIFSGALTRATFPAYAKADLRAGARYNSWEVSLFANNIADRRGVLSEGYPTGTGFVYITPRTVGLNFVKTFGATHHD